MQQGLSVLFWMPRASEIPGGHNVQFDETARALADLGVNVRTERTEEVDFADVDVVHGFLLGAGHVSAVRRAGKRVALSTIYWDREYRLSNPSTKPSLHARIGLARRGTRVARAALLGSATFADAALREVRSEVDTIAAFSAADLLLPNARGELDAIIKDTSVQTAATVVPNGVDPSMFLESTEPSRPRSGILAVGRLEPHKNQLGLIQALAGSGLSLTVAGRRHPHHPEYLEQCRAAGRGWVSFIEDASTAELADLYRSAEVHVLPSWFETTGLVSLEAALAGCKLVTTSRGHAREYFGDLASYCDPADPASIRNAVQAELSRPVPQELRERVLSSYTWRHVAEATLRAYRPFVPDRVAAYIGESAGGAECRR